MITVQFGPSYSSDRVHVLHHSARVVRKCLISKFNALGCRIYRGEIRYKYSCDRCWARNEPKQRSRMVKWHSMEIRSKTGGAGREKRRRMMRWQTGCKWPQLDPDFIQKSIQFLLLRIVAWKQRRFRWEWAQEPHDHILTASMLLTIRSRARLEPRHPLVVSIVALRS